MQWFVYKIPLKPSPLSITNRQGLLCKTDKGWGEAAPLPGFSQETLSEAIASACAGSSPLPSVCFALQSVNQTFPLFFPRVSICALAESLQEAIHWIGQGFTTLKLKIKHLPISHTIEIVRKLQKYPIHLRIDANRTWSLEQTRTFIKSIHMEKIEYLEEPLFNPKELKQLPSCPLALDETLLEPALAKDLIQNSRITTLVLKPTLLGSSLYSWISHARTTGKKLSFSSSFESSIGLVHIAQLQALHEPSLAVGIDTQRYFQSPLFPFPIRKGQIENKTIPPINWNLLTPLDYASLSHP